MRRGKLPRMAWYAALLEKDIANVEAGILRLKSMREWTRPENSRAGITLIPTVIENSFVQHLTGVKSLHP